MDSAGKKIQKKKNRKRTLTFCVSFEWLSQEKIVLHATERGKTVKKIQFISFSFHLRWVCSFRLSRTSLDRVLARLCTRTGASQHELEGMEVGKSRIITLPTFDQPNTLIYDVSVFTPQENSRNKKTVRGSHSVLPNDK